jgi:hypothetical protein
LLIILLRLECALLFAVENILSTLTTRHHQHQQLHKISQFTDLKKSNVPAIVSKKRIPIIPRPRTALFKPPRIHLAYTPLDAVHTNFVGAQTYDWSEPRVRGFERRILDAAPPDRGDPERGEMRQWMRGGDLAQRVADVRVEEVCEEDEGEEHGDGCRGEHCGDGNIAGRVERKSMKTMAWI